MINVKRQKVLHTINKEKNDLFRQMMKKGKKEILQYGERYFFFTRLADYLRYNFQTDKRLWVYLSKEDNPLQLFWCISNQHKEITFSWEGFKVLVDEYVNGKEGGKRK